MRIVGSVLFSLSRGLFLSGRSLAGEREGDIGGEPRARYRGWKPFGTTVGAAFRPSLEGNRSRETSGLLQAEKFYFITLLALQVTFVLRQWGLSKPAFSIPALVQGGGSNGLGHSQLGWGSEGH